MWEGSHIGTSSRGATRWSPRSKGKEMRKRILGIAAMAAASAVLLTGCGGGGEDETGGDVDFTAEPTGTLSAWGFENADDVGQSRLDYAAEQLGDLEIDLDA